MKEQNVNKTSMRQLEFKRSKQVFMHLSNNIIILLVSSSAIQYCNSLPLK